MSQENNILIPSVAATCEEFAAWFISNEAIKGVIQTRLGKESVNEYAEIEIEEGEEKVFLQECDKCDLPKIVHSSLERPTCLFINFGLERQIDAIKIS